MLLLSAFWCFCFSASFLQFILYPLSHIIFGLQISHFSETRRCPADWGFEYLRIKQRPPHSINWETKIEAYKILLDPKYSRLDAVERLTASRIGGEHHTIIEIPGYISADAMLLDGMLTSWNILRFDNKARNVINILATGLAATDERHMTVIGDADIDSVYLDNCLKWGIPKRVHRDDRFPDRWRFTAADERGDRGTVDISLGMTIKLVPRDTIREWVTILGFEGKED